jgi:hypothetical protein
MVTDGRADKYGEANSSIFSTFLCECAKKDGHSCFRFCFVFHTASTDSKDQQFWQFNAKTVFGIPMRLNRLLHPEYAATSLSLL